MAEYIACRQCDSPDCKGCNLKRLETMLENGKFDCLMNENRCINPSADVAPVKHGKWEEAIEPLGWHKVIVASCSVCGDSWVLDEFTIDEYAKWHQYCPSCGARMDGYITMPDTEEDDDE